MWTSSSNREVLAAARPGRARGRIAALAGLICAGLLLAPASAGAAERDAQQAATARKESPYARYAREHAKAAQGKPARVKPTSSVGRGQRPRAPRAPRH